MSRRTQTAEQRVPTCTACSVPGMKTASQKAEEIINSRTFGKTGICHKCGQPDSAHSYGRCPGDLTGAKFINAVVLFDSDGREIDRRYGVRETADLIAELEREYRYKVNYCAIYDGGGWVELSPVLINPAWSRWTDGTRPEAIIELTRLDSTLRRIHATLGV